MRRVSPHRNAPRPTQTGADGLQTIDTPPSILMSGRRDFPKWPMVHCTRSSGQQRHTVEGIHQKGSFGADPRRGVDQIGLYCGERRNGPNCRRGKNAAGGRRERDRNNGRMNHLCHLNKVIVTTYKTGTYRPRSHLSVINVAEIWQKTKNMAKLPCFSRPIPGR